MCEKSSQTCLIGKLKDFRVSHGFLKNSRCLTSFPPATLSPTRGRETRQTDGWPSLPVGPLVSVEKSQTLFFHSHFVLPQSSGFPF